MSLENILNKILEEARQERERILEECREKAAQIKTDADKAVGLEAESLKQQAARAGELEAHRLVTQARLQTKLELLALKKALIEEVLDQAFRKVGDAQTSLRRTVIHKDREEETSMDASRLKEELRAQLEPLVAETLEI